MHQIATLQLVQNPKTCSRFSCVDSHVFCFIVRTYFAILLKNQNNPQLTPQRRILKNLYQYPDKKSAHVTQMTRPRISSHLARSNRQCTQQCNKKLDGRQPSINVVRKKANRVTEI